MYLSHRLYTISSTKNTKYMSEMVSWRDDAYRLLPGRRDALRELHPSGRPPRQKQPCNLLEVVGYLTLIHTEEVEMFENVQVLRS